MNETSAIVVLNIYFDLNNVLVFAHQKDVFAKRSSNYEPFVSMTRFNAISRGTKSKTAD